MMTSTRGIWIVIAMLFALLLPAVAFGQGCALCYTQAANSGARLIQALRNGIVILILPPVSICVGAIALAYRRRDQFSPSDTTMEGSSEW
jgi:hypothetical protein